jgi:hypothetical protein
LFAILGKTIAQRWKKLDDPHRITYKTAASEDMKRYRGEMDNYHSTIAKTVVREDKRGKSKSKKSRKASADESVDVDERMEKKASPALVSTGPKTTHTGIVKPAALAGLQSPNPGLDTSSLGLADAVPDGLDAATYHSFLRQRELLAFHERMAMSGQAGIGFPLGSGGGGIQNFLRGGAFPAGLRMIDTPLAGNASLMGSPPPFFRGGLPSPGLSGMRGELSQEEQLFLLRRNQETANLSIRQRLELMQQQDQSRQMQQLFELQLQQQQQPSPAMAALMQERQHLLERQRLEQMLMAQMGNQGMGGAGGFGQN